jgi:biotin carboxyl carrier protein
MKVHVRVEGRTFEVEVGDLAALPIIAVVDGRRFEVWPSTEAASPGDTAAQGIDQVPAPGGLPPSAAAGEGGGRAVEREGADAAGEKAGHSTSQRSLRAPIPGVVESIAVSVGDRVARGDELLVLEAMKMRNAIRAPRAGVIVAVHVTAGQHVNHNDPLVDYGD